jgi:hypothetical protein
MAKKDPPIDLSVVHPEPDTSANDAVGAEGPPTWQPGGKATQDTE